MALVYSCNQDYTGQTGAKVWYDFIQFLVARGWQVVNSSDGLNATPSPTLVTGSGSGAGGFNNVDAWIHIRMPASMSTQRGYVFHRSATGSPGNIRIYYFGHASVVNVAGTTTVPPSCSSANVQSQDLTGNINYTGTLNRISFWADNAAPFGFGIHGCDTSGNSTFHFVLEALQTGSYNVLDQEPYLNITFNNANNTNFIASSSNSLDTFWGRCSGKIQTWGLRHNMAGAVWMPASYSNSPPNWGAWYYNCMSAVSYGIVQGNWNQSSNGLADISRGAQPTNYFDTKMDELPLFYARPGGFHWQGYPQYSSTNYGYGTIMYHPDTYWKGCGKYLRIPRQDRTNLSTLTTVTTRDRIVYGHITAPWDGSVPVLVA